MMWQISGIASILKDYAMQTSYQNFKDRRKAAALCADLLSSYEERHIITMLFREGLGDCLTGAPYSTAYDLSLAKNRVCNFAKKYGLEKQIVDDLTELIGLFADASMHGSDISISEVLKVQRDKDQTFQAEKNQRVSVVQKSDFDKLICVETESLSIGSDYQDESVPTLVPFDRLRKFSNFFPLAYQQLSEINLQNMVELRFTITNSDADVSINAPMLEKLSLWINNNNYEQLTPLERMLQCGSPVLRLTTPRLRYLELGYFSGIDLSVIGEIDDLEVLIIRHTEIMDLKWLSGCKNLKKLHIYSELPDIALIPPMENLRELYLDYDGITSLEPIALFPNLRILSLRGNKISSVQNADKLNHIRRIDLSRNPVSEAGGVAALSVSELILSDVDRELYSFDKKIDDVFWRAYQVFKHRENNLDNLAPYMKRSWMSKTDTENYCSLVNAQFASSFFSYNPSCTWTGYDTKLKRQYLEFAKERYPFLTISEEFEKQIQTEQFGITHYYKESPGTIIYLNQSIYIVRVKLEDNGKGIELNYANTSGGGLKKADIEKLINCKCNYIDLTHTKVSVFVFDLFQTGNVDGIDAAIVAALYSLYYKISFPSNVFVSGAYNKKGAYKKEKILSRVLRLAQMQGAKRIFYLTSGKKSQIKENDTIIEYCNALEELNECAVLRQ